MKKIIASFICGIMLSLSGIYLYGQYAYLNGYNLTKEEDDNLRVPMFVAWTAKNMPNPEFYISYQTGLAVLFACRECSTQDKQRDIEDIANDIGKTGFYPFAVYDMVKKEWANQKDCGE